MGWWEYRPYVSVAQRRAKAMKYCEKLKKQGREISPVTASRKIAETFWGKAWCENLESYSDFENRLPRGRTYVRNGSVVDLQIEAGKVKAIVSGSEIYHVEIKIKPLAAKQWAALKQECGGQIASVVELLQGKLSKGVMEIMTRHGGGLFPKPAEITMECSCPDWAGMCKHIAAVLYGVGARLDERPELLFVLRKVDHMELIEQAGNVQAIGQAEAGERKTIAAGDLADVFGIDLDSAAAAAPAGTQPAASPPKPARKTAKRTKPAAPDAADQPAPAEPPVPAPAVKPKRAVRKAKQG